MQSYKSMNSFDIESHKDSAYFQNDPAKLFANTRLGFVQKVYGILTCQLIFTVLLSIISMTSKSFMAFQVHNYGILIFCVILTIIIMIILFCYKEPSRTTPTNYILLAIFTICESWIVSTFCGITNPKIVLMATLMTLGIVISLTLYAITTKTDFTIMGGLMYVLGMALLLFALFSLFSDNKIFHIIISVISVVIFGIYLIYDTQLIIGNGKHGLEIDDYIIGALILYMDIITLFLELVNLIKNVSND